MTPYGIPGRIQGASPINSRADGNRTRRSFTVDYKRQAVDELLTSGETLSVVARKHRISPNHLSTWKRLYNAGKYSPFTSPMPPTKVQAPAKSTDTGEGLVELHLPKGSVVIRGAADTELIRNLVAVLQ